MTDKKIEKHAIDLRALLVDEYERTLDELPKSAPKLVEGQAS